MLFDNLERIEKSLYTPCRGFTIKNVVILGKKGRDNKKLSAIHKYSYATNKYSTHARVNVVKLEISEFIVFEYNDGDKNNREEIYISYPHLERVIDGFKAMAVALRNNDLFIEDEESGELFLNADYSDFSIKISNLTNGKSILLVPNVIEDENYGEMAGVTIYLGSPRKIVDSNYEVFDTIVYFLNNFNLNLHSQLLVNFAALEEIASGGAEVAPAGSVVKTPSKRVKRKIKPPTPSKRITKDEIEEEEIEEDLFVDEDDIFSDESENDDNVNEEESDLFENDNESEVGELASKFLKVMDEMGDIDLTEDF